MGSADSTLFLIFVSGFSPHGRREGRLDHDSPDFHDDIGQGKIIGILFGRGLQSNQRLASYLDRMIRSSRGHELRAHCWDQITNIRTVIAGIRISNAHGHDLRRTANHQSAALLCLPTLDEKLTEVPTSPRNVTAVPNMSRVRRLVGFEPCKRTAE
jgi:hypothetical protein